MWPQRTKEEEGRRKKEEDGRRTNKITKCMLLGIGGEAGGEAEGEARGEA